MKRDEYFQIMDAVSEENITEMIQYHRSRRTPVRKEKTMITQKKTRKNQSDGFAADAAEINAVQNGNEIRITRSKSYTAAAVAAVLLVLNISGGLMLLKGRNQESMSSSAGCSVDEEHSEKMTDAVSAQSTDVSEMISEQTTEVTASVPRDDLPQYV